MKKKILTQHDLQHCQYTQLVINRHTCGVGVTCVSGKVQHSISL